MQIVMIIYTTSVVILIGTNGIKSEEVHADYTMKPTTIDQDAISTPQESETVSSNQIPTKDSNILSPVLFTSYLADILSPKLFSEPNILQYFLNSTTKLSDTVLGTQLFNVKYLLYKGAFPKRYVIYAEILSSILECQVRLQRFQDDIREIEGSAEFIDPSSIPDTPLTEETAVLRAFFSPDIISDASFPSRLLIKLVEIPERKLTNVATLMNKLSKNNEIPEKYDSYATDVSLFIRDYGHRWLRDLRRDLVKVQRRRKLKS